MEREYEGSREEYEDAQRYKAQLDIEAEAFALVEAEAERDPQLECVLFQTPEGLLLLRWRRTLSRARGTWDREWLTPRRLGYPSPSAETARGAPARPEAHARRDAPVHAPLPACSRDSKPTTAVPADWSKVSGIVVKPCHHSGALSCATCSAESIAALRALVAKLAEALQVTLYGMHGTGDPPPSRCSNEKCRSAATALASARAAGFGGKK